MGVDLIYIVGGLPTTLFQQYKQTRRMKKLAS